VQMYGLHTNKSTFSICLVNQVSRQTISRISQSDSQLLLRRSVRQSVNPIRQSGVSQSQQSVNHVAVSLFNTFKSIALVSQSVHCSHSLHHQSVRLSNYPSVRLYHSNLPFSRHSLITSHSLESRHSVASVGKPISPSVHRKTIQSSH
jgi:hypothetical protein